MDDMSHTLAGLRNIGLVLRWSPAGRGNDWPQPSILDLGRAFQVPLGRKALQTVLARGKHVRTPPECWRRLRASLRCRWFRRLDKFRGSSALAWRLLLWELDHRGGAVGNGRFDWTGELNHAGIRCRDAAGAQPRTR